MGFQELKMARLAHDVSRNGESGHAFHHLLVTGTHCALCTFTFHNQEYLRLHFKAQHAHEDITVTETIR